MMENQYAILIVPAPYEIDAELLAANTPTVHGPYASTVFRDDLAHILAAGLKAPAMLYKLTMAIELVDNVNGFKTNIEIREFGSDFFDDEES